MISITARKNLEAHIAGERAGDLAALMAPLAPDPRYIVPDYVLEGRAAVAEMYRRVKHLLAPALSDEYLRALDDPGVTRWGQDHCVIEYSSDYPLHRGMVVVVHFENDLLKSENTYFTTSKGFFTARRVGSLADIPGANPIDS